MMAMNQKLFYSDRIKKRIDNLFNYLQWAESFVEPYKSIEKEFKKQNQTIERYKKALEFYADEDHWGMIDGVSYLKGADQWIAKEALENTTP